MTKPDAEVNELAADRARLDALLKAVAQLDAFLERAAVGSQQCFEPNRDPDDLAKDAIEWTEGRSRADHARLPLDARTLRYCGWRVWHWLSKLR